MENEKKIVIVILYLLSLPMFAQKITELKTDKEKLSYSIGSSMAQRFVSMNLKNDIDLEILNQAMNDIFRGENILFSQDSINNFLKKYEDRKTAELKKNEEEYRIKKKAEEVKFLEQNKKKKGVITTTSGLQYKILAKGNSKEKPQSKDLVKIKYETQLTDGTVLNSTDKDNSGQPVFIMFTSGIKGLGEGLKLMTKGSKYRFFIPSELAYGENGVKNQGVEPYSTLIYDVELIDFMPIPALGTEVAPDEEQKVINKNK